MQSDSERASLKQTTHKTDILYSEGFKIPTIVNRRIVNCEVRNRSKPEEKATSILGNKFLKSSHKVLIIGDSHLKGSAVRTNQFLNTKFSVCSFIKPGATINQYLRRKNNSKTLEKKDVIVISGWANDMNNGDKVSEVLSKMTKFMQTYNNTNIAIMSIPHRYDLDNDSRINLAIQKLNSKVQNKTQLFRHVSKVETGLNRKYYTKHGLHLNNSGKEGLARSIATLINKLVHKDNKDKTVITLNWKEEVNMNTSVQVSPDQLKLRHLEGTDKISIRTSTEQKKKHLLQGKKIFYGHKHN
jgi:hypothetical protein